MGRKPCCDKVGLKRGPWSIEEDQKLINFIVSNGIHCWRQVPKLAGLLRCGKSCRLRWINYLRPDLKRGDFTEREENYIIQLHACLGNKWSQIASQFPGRTDNEIKNHWNTRIKKKMKKLGMDPVTHRPIHKVENENKMHVRHVTASNFSPMEKLPVEVKIDATNEGQQDEKPSKVSSSLDDSFDLASIENIEKSDEPIFNIQKGFHQESIDGTNERGFEGREEEKLSKISSSLDDTIDLINSYEFVCGGFQVWPSVHMGHENFTSTSSTSSISMEDLNNTSIVDFNSADHMLLWDGSSIKDDNIFYTNF